MPRRAPLALVVAASLAPLVLAAEAAIEDGEGDANVVEDATLSPESRERAASELDVLAVAVESGADSFTVRLRLASMGSSVGETCDRCAWAVAWEWAGDTWGVFLARTPAADVPQLLSFSDFASESGVGPRGPDPPSTQLPYRVSTPIVPEIAEGEIAFRVPFAALPGAGPGSVLERPFAETLFRPQTTRASSRAVWYHADRGPDCRPGETGGTMRGCTLFGESIALVPPASPTPLGARENLDGLVRAFGVAFAVLVVGLALFALARGRGTALEAAAVAAAAARGSSPALEPPRYEKLKLLGEGASGRAFLAEDRKLKRRVVVKELPPARAGDEQARRRFLHEARVAGQLNHPNVVTVHDIVEDGSRVEIVMEHVEGGSLEARIARGPLTLADAVRLVREMLAGLDVVHRAGVVHRDLKPANVLLTGDGHAKIGDFGVAHAPFGDTAVGLTSAGQQPGTPLYMAPEQARGLSADGRADLYATAAILAEAVTGRHYLDGRRLGARRLWEAIESGSPDLDALPLPVRAVAARALEKDPEARYPSAAVMASALREAAIAAGLTSAADA